MKGACRAIIAVCATFILTCALVLGMRASYPRPYAEVVRESGVPAALAYAVMKAESNFDESAVSRAGAVGIMQVRPSTAEFICRKRGLEFHGERLFDGTYNVRIGCMYLAYLLSLFSDDTAAICAYNAGMGNVTSWLENPEYSSDGVTLNVIPFGETQEYLKRVIANRDMYRRLYARELVQS